MENLPHLKCLALPASVISTADHSTLRSPFEIHPDLATSSNITLRSAIPSASQIAARRIALERTATAELDVIERVITHKAPRLEKVIFTRPVRPADRAEASVVYSCLTPFDISTPARWASGIEPVADGSSNPLPPGVKRYPVYSVRRWKEATRGSPVPALAAAAGGGIVLGEVLRGAYKAGLLANVNVFLWSALSATAATAALTV